MKGKNMKQLKTKLCYVRPMSEVIRGELSTAFMDFTGVGNAGNADDGGVVGDVESKIFSSWEFQDRLDIPSDKLGNSFDD